MSENFVMRRIKAWGSWERWGATKPVSVDRLTVEELLMFLLAQDFCQRTWNDFVPYVRRSDNLAHLYVKLVVVCTKVPILVDVVRALGLVQFRSDLEYSDGEPVDDGVCFYQGCGVKTHYGCDHGWFCNYHACCDCPESAIGLELRLLMEDGKVKTV